MQRACHDHIHTFVRLSCIYSAAGESDDEVVDALYDLRDVGVDIVTFGQYLQPTPHHLEVQEFVTPEKFEHW